MTTAFCKNVFLTGTDILAECATYDRSQRQTRENFNGGVNNSLSTTIATFAAENDDQNRSAADPMLTMFPRMPKIQAPLSMPRYESFFPATENSADAVVNYRSTSQDRRNSNVSPYTVAEQSRTAAGQNFPSSSSSIRNAGDGSQNGGDFVQRFRNLGIHFNTQIR
uniref:Uncharacterized protein n=1 Tax=Romanomermis culicivorax TaxID=13658 RepID=A0A915HQD5_ROMCU